MKITNKQIFTVLVVLVLMSIASMCTYDRVKAAPNVCGADDTCVNVNMYHFCDSHSEIAPEPKDFIARIHNVSKNQFFDQVMTVDEVRGNTFIMVTTFTGLDVNNVYKVMIHYNNQAWVPWTNGQKPPFDLQIQLGENCLPYSTYLPLVSK